MPKISWDTWKKSFPFKCEKCGHVQSSYQQYCEQCGTKRSLIKTEKSDYKKWKKKN